MRALSAVLFVSFGSLLLTACSCGNGDDHDHDSGTIDAGSGDGGVRDAGSMDAGTMDAGTMDAGTMDAGTIDAGTMDAGAIDAGAPDAGTVDAGAPDAGRQLDDAGCPLPTGRVFDPADAGLPASGLVLWLRADFGVATFDGGSVCRWEDVSGNARHFLPNGANVPHLDAVRLGGRPAVVFSTGSYLQRQDVLGLDGGQGRTFAARSQIAETSSRFSTILHGNRANNWQYFGLDQNTFMTVGGREGVYVTANAYDATLTTANAARTHVYSISTLAPATALPGAIVYSVDGVVQTLTRTPGGNGPSGPGNNVVWDFSGANYTSIGESAVPGITNASIGEVLVYDHALTTNERLAVEDYLTP